MKTLYVLRHGQAAPESQASSDHERPLTERGLAEVRLSAERLAGRPKPPSSILSSSAARASATAELCRLALPAATRLTIVNDLYLAEPASYLSALTAGGDPHDAVLVVGHNPGLEALVYLLTQQSEHLATASLVEIHLPIALWSDLSAWSSRGGAADGEVGGTIVDHFRAHR